VGILARVPLASGLLTGKLSRDWKFDSGDHRVFNRHGESFDRGETFAGVDYETALAAVDVLRALVPAGMTMTQFALRWIQMFPSVTCSIPGAKTPAQAEDNFRAADLPDLTPDVMEKVRAVYDTRIRPLVHPYW
jgi:aryl-alcohol dehydrogenase-like predicted oxidoreductase